MSITAAGRSDGFVMPMTTFEDMMVEYYAYDFDGNVAICQVNYLIIMRSFTIHVIYFIILFGCCFKFFLLTRHVVRDSIHVKLTCYVS